MEPVAIRRSIRLKEYDYAADGAYFITVCIQHKEHRFGHIADGEMVLNEAGRMIAERIQAIPAKFPGTLIDSFVVMPNHIHFILSLLGYVPNIGLIPNDKSVPNGGYVGAAPRGRPLSDRQGRPDMLPTENDNLGSGIMPDESDWLSISGPIGPKAGGHEGPPLQINVPVVGNATDGSDSVENNVKASNVPSLSEVVGWFKASTTNYYIKGVKAGTYPAFDRRLWQRNYYEHIIRTEAAYNQIEQYIRANLQRWAEDRLR